jgi:signal transduction histidine kinase
LTVVALAVFGVAEVWPRRLPAWLPRWLWQLLGVVVSVPPTVTAFYIASTAPGAPPFWTNTERLGGFGLLCFSGVLIGGWSVLSALVVQREAAVREQALGFALERSELERQALDAHLRLMRAQVEPHFIFNTLANVRALVDSGSPQASSVLGSLIAYLRAAIPRLATEAPTLAQEVDLVRAYLELMHTRMPDRLSFSFDIPPEALAQPCPPLTLMTLVENAVRHGIDPSEDGGRIEIQARLDAEQLQLRVADTGLGLDSGSQGLGTGLAALRERLRLVFGPQAQLTITEAQPHGVVAELSWPQTSKDRGGSGGPA